MLRWFILGFFVLYIVWLTTGGPERMENKTNPFLRQPTKQQIDPPVDTIRVERVYW